MGQASAIITALGSCGCCNGIESCNKYTLNACRMNSKCCQCFEFSIETDEIPLSDSGSEEEFEAVGCLKYHHS